VPSRYEGKARKEAAVSKQIKTVPAGNGAAPVDKAVSERINKKDVWLAQRKLKGDDESRKSTNE
jgi:hypothetical protein